MGGEWGLGEREGAAFNFNCVSLGESLEKSQPGVASSTVSRLCNNIIPTFAFLF